MRKESKCVSDWELMKAIVAKKHEEHFHKPFWSWWQKIKMSSSPEGSLLRSCQPKIINIPGLSLQAVVVLL